MATRIFNIQLQDEEWMDIGPYLTSICFTERHALVDEYERDSREYFTSGESSWCAPVIRFSVFVPFDEREVVRWFTKLPCLRSSFPFEWEDFSDKGARHCLVGMARCIQHLANFQYFAGTLFDVEFECWGIKKSMGANALTKIENPPQRTYGRIIERGT
jgi:hypothetical protein